MQGAYEVVDENDSVVKEAGSDMPQQHVDDGTDDDVHNDVEKAHDVVLEVDTSYSVDDTPSSSFHSYYFHNDEWHVLRHVNYELRMVAAAAARRLANVINLRYVIMSTVLVSNHFPQYLVASSPLHLTAEQLCFWGSEQLLNSRLPWH